MSADGAAADIKRLQRCISDLASLTALSATWIGAEPSQIAATLVDALHRVLDADFIYMRVADPLTGAKIEAFRAASGPNGLTRSAATPIIELGSDSSGWPARASSPRGEFGIAAAQLGLHGDPGFVLAGSQRADFPLQTEQLLLNVAANQAVVGLQEARMLSAQRQVVEELDERVAGRTAELAAANRALEAEVVERRRAQAALSKSEAELRRAHAQLSEGQRLSKTGSFTWDVLADEHAWSPELRRIFGFDPAAELAMPMIQSAVHPNDLTDVERAIAGAHHGRDFDLVFRLVTPQGQVRHAHVVGHRIEHIVDRPVFVGAIQDVTESRIAEEALDRARRELAQVSRIATLSALTASIAHEIDQPLAGIVINGGACLRMLAMDPPDIEGAGATAQRTIRDANRASEVIKGLRALFARKTSGEEPVDLSEAAREVLVLTSGELQSRRVVLQADLAQDLPTISGNRVQLQQVIMNLVLNAVQAMQTVDDRPRQLRIATASDGDQVQLSVRDSGVGAASDKLEQLFAPFFTTRPEGIGVGLAISRSIIEAHSGRISAMPNDGPGLTFSLSLPVNPGPGATL